MTDIQALNAIIDQLGGSTIYKRNIQAYNAWSVLQGGTGAYVRDIDALNAIDVLNGGSGDHRFNIDALNSISLAVGGTGDYISDISVLIELGSVLDQNSPPAISDIAISLVSDTGFTITANIDPNGAETAVTIEYGLTTEYSEAPIVPTGSPLSLPGEIVGQLVALKTFSLYHFRVKAVNSEGATYSSDYMVNTLSVFSTKTVLTAHSLRLINPDYTGACLRVVRSSDSATLDVGFRGLYIDVDALTDFVGAATGYVSILYDQSGNARNLIRATGQVMPKIINAGVLCMDKDGLRPAIHFDTLYACWQTAAFTAVAQPYSKIAFIDFGSTIAPQEYVSDGNTANRNTVGSGLAATPIKFRLASPTIVDYAVGPAINTNYVLNAIFNGAASKLIYNDTVLANVNTGTNAYSCLTIAQHPNLNLSYIQFFGIFFEHVVVAGDSTAYAATVKDELMRTLSFNYPVSILNGAILTEDGGSYLTTEDGQFYLQSETAPE
jgi:hypothetical protein